MQPPRLLAIDDVRLTAPGHARAALIEFYSQVLGFTPCEAGESGDCLVFRGTPRSGPRLLIDLQTQVPAKPLRRQALLQVASLYEYAAVLNDARIAFEWSRGWFCYDRRIGLMDPAGNWIELTASHLW